MASKEIRLQYSGFIVFAAKLLSIATGLIFALMIAQSTTQGQYDIWFNINDVLAYFTLLMGVVPFWVMRFVARGRQAATKTGFITNLMISFISTIIYLAFTPLIISGLDIGAQYSSLYLLASIQIVELYAISLLEGCLQASSPQKVGYGLLFQQFFKVALGYILIVELGQPLWGAVISVILAFAIQAAYYYKLLAREMKQRIRWDYVRDWLKGSPVIVYNVIGYQIVAVVFILLFSYGGTGARSIYGAAFQIAHIITYASFLSYALYPKLLAERKLEDITTSLRLVLMFAIPMTAGVIGLADSYITILRPDYADAFLVLIVLAIDSLVLTVSGIFSAVIFGLDMVDSEKISFKALVRSRLFLVFSFPYLQAAITIPAAYFALTNYAFEEPLLAALSVSVIILVGHFVSSLASINIARKMIRINVPWRNIAKYAIASTVMGILLLLMPYSDSLMMTLVMTAIGGAVYILLLGIIDKDSRELAKAVFQRITRSG